MQSKTVDMAELDDRDHEVLAVLVEGRVNPYYLREQTTLEKGDVTTVLNRLGRGGYIVQVTRGLYEITDKGRDTVADREEEQ